MVRCDNCRNEIKDGVEFFSDEYHTYCAECLILRASNKPILGSVVDGNLQCIHCKEPMAIIYEDDEYCNLFHWCSQCGIVIFGKLPIDYNHNMLLLNDNTFIPKRLRKHFIITEKER